MTLDSIFGLCSLLAVIGWIALLAAPVSRTSLVRTARLFSALLAIGYVIQLFTITQPVQGGSFSTLGGVSALFSMPGNVMLGWTHFLAFDLFTGAWEVEDSGRIGIPHWAVLVPLGLTFLFGPVGLLTYGAIRTAHLLRTTGRML